MAGSLVCTKINGDRGPAGRYVDSIILRFSRICHTIDIHKMSCLSMILAVGRHLECACVCVCVCGGGG